jgi:hypothetical protein
MTLLPSIVAAGALLIAAAGTALAQGNESSSITGAGRDERSLPGKVEVGVGTTDEVTTGNSGPDEPGTRAAASGWSGAGAGAGEGPRQPAPEAAPGCAALADPAARERCSGGG